MNLKRSRLSVQQRERLLEHFVAGTPARTAAELVGVNRNTATHFYHRLRELIANRLERVSPFALQCPSPGSESSGGDRQNGGATSDGQRRLLVLGVFVRGGKVYTALLRSAQAESALASLRMSANAEAIVHVETFELSALLDLGGRRQPQRRRGRVSQPRASIGCAQNFQSQLRRNLRKYNGVPLHHLLLFLKECEWRFNYGSPRRLLEILGRWLCEPR